MPIISYRPRVTKIDPALLERARPFLVAHPLPAAVPADSAALAVACQTASIAAGFSQIQIQGLPGGLLRVEGSDGLGRGLISEIQNAKGELRLATEVTGIRDGSCRAVMERFDAALEKEGIVSPPPRRKWTGGVAELAAAKAFLQRTAARRAEAERRRTERARRLNAAVTKQTR